MLNLAQFDSGGRAAEINFKIINKNNDFFSIKNFYYNIKKISCYIFMFIIYYITFNNIIYILKLFKININN